MEAPEAGGAIRSPPCAPTRPGRGGMELRPDPPGAGAIHSFKSEKTIGKHKKHFKMLLMFKYSPLPYSDVRITDPFWGERQRVNHEKSLPKQHEMCERTGRFEALKLQWKPGDENRPHHFWDSDTAKWLEAACYACRIRDDADLRGKIDRVAELFEKAQQPDGYLNSYFTQIDTDRRWKNLRFNHELYCAGHIFEAAVAHHELTGSDSLLRVACRFADYIGSVFGTEEGKIPGYCGHEEIELALVRLYQATGQSRHLELASYFVEQRGRQPLWFKLEQEGVIPPDFQGHGFVDDYVQAHVPVREQQEVCGHAVRAVYLYCALADVAREKKDPTLFAAAERLWSNLTECKLYVTGGIGSSWVGEAFSTKYDLPNERAYCETCASVGLIFWAHRMLQHSGDPAYADVLERALYNGALAGMSLDGESFFYQNPLASFGGHNRQDWFECSCCPSNLSRLLATLGSHIYSESADEWLVHLYIGSEARFGSGGRIRQSGGSPWDGHVEFEIDPAAGREIGLGFRIPSWCGAHEVLLNGAGVDAVEDRGYIRLRRAWRSGDRVSLRFEMPVIALAGNPRLMGNSGQIALQRGPFVYCIEDADFAGSVLGVRVSFAQKFDARFDTDLLGGVTVIEGRAVADANSPDTLYHRWGPAAGTGTRFRAIPYFAWNNRSRGAMRVWIPIAPEQ